MNGTGTETPIDKPPKIYTVEEREENERRKVLKVYEEHENNKRNIKMLEQSVETLFHRFEKLDEKFDNLTRRIDVDIENRITSAAIDSKNLQYIIKNSLGIKNIYDGRNKIVNEDTSPTTEYNDDKTILIQDVD